MGFVSLDYDSYREIMTKEFITMCKQLDELEKSIEERKNKENGSNSDTSGEFLQ